MIPISIRSLMLPILRYLRTDRALYLRLGSFYGIPRNIMLRCARLFGGYDDNMVVFSSFYCHSYNDNPRYISEALHAARPETKIVWLFDEPEKVKALYDVPDYVHILQTTSRKGVFALARARVVVDNTVKRFYLKFPGKGQFYIQTWHGDRAFKKVGYDHEDFRFRKPEMDASLVMVGSDSGEQVLRTALRHHAEVMKLGCARNDILVRNDPAEAAAIRAKLSLDDDTCILTYAPTFRDTEVNHHQKQAVPLDLNHVLDTLERTTGKRWKCLVRAHYFVSGLTFEDNSGRLILASNYPEMADLLLISDALLTDYSSCAGDFVLLHRPVYLYQNDMEQYETENRQFYTPMSELDFWIARTPEELDRLIEQTTPERAAENCDRIMEFYGFHETGHAADAAVEYIISKLKPAKGSSQ